MEVLLSLLFHWFISLFCQSFFLHRYCSHRMFTMNKFWERFFYGLTFISQGASFLNPRSYSYLHNKHHKHSDMKEDPHSPHHSKNIFTMMMHTYHEYQDALKNAPSENTKCPEWKSLDKFAQGKLNTPFWIIVYICYYQFLELDFILYLLTPLHFLVGPTQGAIVNWFGHKIGYRNFKTNDESKNTLPIDFALMGELYQNNHHKFAQKFNFANRWFEIDFTYQLSKILIWLNIIKLRSSI